MFRLFAVLGVLALAACGTRHPIIDAGMEDDAGSDAGFDAGRPRGDDPPTGWMTAGALDPDAGASARLGVSVASAPDRYGQPLVAAIFDDPNGDGVRLDTRVVFTRWNGTDHRFDPLHTVETVGDLVLAPPNRQVSIALDAITGRIGIAYVKGAEIRLAWSDDEGENFSLETVSDSAGHTASNPQLALNRDTLYLAYVTDEPKVVYRARLGTGSFSDFTPPLPAGMATLAGLPVSLVLDSAGHPGLLYFSGASGSPTTTLAFWRPGTPSAAAIADSAQADLSVAGREPSSTLAFAGEKPRAVFHLRKVDPAPVSDDTPELFFAAASDPAGTQWGTPVAVPRNGDGTRYNSTRWYQGVSIDSAGKVSVAADFFAMGIVGGMCGGPKLARSTDGTSFTTCAPLGTPYNFAGDWLSLWAHSSTGKLTLIFHYDTRTNPSVRPGIEMWREP